MGVIVTSSAHQIGSTMGGDVAHIIVVKTAPGYAPNVGHAGTGQVITTAC